MAATRTYDEVLEYARRICERFDWHLQTDAEMLESLIEGLQRNFNDLGYYNCPCRESAHDAKADRDIICPCLYARDADVADFGYCYCALFFRKDFDPKKATSQIPERRPPRP